MSEAEMLAGKAPFHWSGAGSEAVLCIHGFTGAPGVFRKLGSVFHREGLSVYAPLLPGHGTSPEFLANATGQQWINAVEQAYEDLLSGCERVHIIGLSLGGTLATLLAANHVHETGIGSVTLLSPGYGFNRALSERLHLDVWTDSPEHYGRMIPIPRRVPQNDEMDECIFGYDAAPYSIFGQVLALNKAARDAWPQVTAPVLLLYAETDAVVDAAACREAAEKLPNVEESCGFQKSEHNLLLGCDRAETIQRCTAFIRRHRLDTREGGVAG